MVAIPVEPGLVLRPLTREQYDILLAAGMYENQRVEMVEGVVVETATPQGPERSFAVRRLATCVAVRLATAFGERYEVSPQVPFAATELSEPEPDLYVIDGADSTPIAHPSRAHLVIEIAQSSQRKDLGVKARTYPAAVVPQYWVVDLAARRVVVHADPLPGDGTAATATYGTVRHLPLDAELDLFGLTVRLSDLLA